MKSEPDEFSFADLKARPDRREPWTGVRNYQVRNMFRDEFAVGDLALIYHSSCTEPGVAGLARVVSPAFPDPTQLDPSSAYFDPKSRQDCPRWLAVEIEWACDFPRFVPLADLRGEPGLAALGILRRGNRLSVTPLTQAEFGTILGMAGVETVGGL